MSASAPRIERLSIELSQRCSKACWFCYSHSYPEGATRWTAEDLVRLVEDCARHGVRAVSLGGGEPLESPLLWPVLRRLRGVLFRSLTSNGLALDDPAVLDRLCAAGPDKVHVSIHFPGNDGEVRRVIAVVRALGDRGVPSGVNLLVRRSGLDAARRAATALGRAGIGNDRIVYLPMRGQDTPTAEQVATVAAGAAGAAAGATGPFQSMSCLTGCAASPRFCSIGFDRSVAWCSYTTARARLAEPSHAALMGALDGLGLVECGTSSTRRGPALSILAAGASTS